jgi:hypothetical protein
MQAARRVLAMLCIARRRAGRLKWRSPERSTRFYPANCLTPLMVAVS